MNFSTDAIADFEGLLAVNREICKQQMSEKAPPDVPPYCAVFPYQDGVDVKTIQAIIGHADVGTTMNIYVHADDSKKQECMKKLGDMLTA